MFLASLCLLAVLLVVLSLFFNLFLVEVVIDASFRVRDEVKTSHVGLEGFGDFDTVFSLIVLQDTAHCPLSGTHGTVQHMDKPVLIWVDIL